VAIVAVFATHAFGIRFLWGGVDLFFVLSGFLITNVLLNSKTRPFGEYLGQFYERRARRILPAYCLLLVVMSFFYGVAWFRSWYFYLFLNNLLYVFHIYYPHALGVLWSLAVEEQFYLMWPFAVYFLVRRHLRAFCIALIVLAPVLRATVHFADGGDIYVLTPFRMDLLAAGGLLCLIWREKPEWIKKAGPAIGCSFCFLGLLSLIALGHLGITSESNTRISNVLVFEASLVMWLGFMVYALSGWQIGWLKLAPLRYIGRISYSMYLIHFGILIGLRQIFHNPYKVAALAFALSTAYAALSWILLERNLIKPTVQAPRFWAVRKTMPA